MFKDYEVEYKPAVVGDKAQLSKGNGPNARKGVHTFVRSCMKCQLEELPNIAAYAYQDVHVRSAF